MTSTFTPISRDKFFLDNNRTRINPNHAAKLARILDRLDASIRPQDMNLPGFKLHELSGKEKGTWSVWITGNWRVTFQFHGPEAIAVDYRDYH